MTTFQIEVVKKEKYTLVKLSGSYLLDEEEILKSTFEKIKDKNILVDLTDLHFINSSGLGILYFSCISAKKANKNFALVNVPKKILNIFDILGALEKLTIYKTLGEATKHLV